MRAAVVIAALLGCHANRPVPATPACTDALALWSAPPMELAPKVHAAAEFLESDAAITGCSDAQLVQALTVSIARLHDETALYDLSEGDGPRVEGRMGAVGILRAISGEQKLGEFSHIGGMKKPDFAANEARDAATLAAWEAWWVAHRADPLAVVTAARGRR